MIHKFLNKLSEANWVPHKGQLEYLYSQARFRVLACGRRWGKTDAAAAAMAFHVFNGNRTRQIAIAPTLTQAKIVFERVCWMLAAAGVVFTSTMSPHPLIRVFEDANNKKSSVLHILDARSGHEADHLRGVGADHVLLDEAAYLSESLVMNIAMPMLAASNGRMTLISTPRGRNLFYRLFLRGQNGEPDFWSRHAPSTENPQVSSEYLKLQKELMTDRAFLTEYEAEFLETNSSVFGYDDIEACLDAPLVNGTLIAGVDWGRYTDNTAVALIRTREHRAELIDIKAWTGQKFSIQVDKVIEMVKDAKIVFSDATGIGMGPTEALQSTLRNSIVEGIQFNTQSKAAMIENLQSLIEKRRIRLLGDTDLIRELETFEATQGETNLKYSAPNNMFDDRVCALALACSGIGRSQAIRIISKERRNLT